MPERKIAKSTFKEVGMKVSAQWSAPSSLKKIAFKYFEKKTYIYWIFKVDSAKLSKLVEVSGVSFGQFPVTLGRCISKAHLYYSSPSTDYTPSISASLFSLKGVTG